MSRRRFRRFGAGGAKLCPALVAVVRRPRGLSALVSTPLVDGLCRTSEVRLDEVALDVCPARDMLLTAWHALDAGDGARALDAARTVARATRPAADTPRCDPSLVRQALGALDGSAPVDWRRALGNGVVVRALTGEPIRAPRRFAEQVSLEEPSLRRALLTAWHRLGLEHEPGLRDQVMALVVRRPAACWQAWLGLLPDVHPSLREALVMAVLDHGVTGPPPFGPPALLACRSEATVSLLVRGVLAGLRAEEMLVGLQLGADELPELGGSRVRRPHPRPEGWWDALADWAANVDVQDGEPSRWGAWLWVRAIRSPLLCEILMRPEWRHHSTDVIHRLFEVLAVDRPEDEATLRPMAMELLHALARTPEDARLRLLEEFRSLLDDREARRWAVPGAKLLCTGPVRSVRTGWAAAGLLKAAHALGAPGQLLELTPAFLRRLDEDCRADGRARRLERGLRVLAAERPAIVMEAVGRWPRPLFRTARALGSLSEPRARRVIRDAQPDGAAVMPRRLRLALEGRLELTASSMERHRRAMSARDVPAQLRAIREHAIGEALRGLPLDRGSDADVHCAQMIASQRLVRRSLRRFVRAGCPPRAQHPRNVAWLRRHPRLDAELWSAGLVRELEVPPHGVLRLALEHRPLEALRLGSHVGTCVGLGGLWSDSAASWVLDVNKQVLYARRLRDGHVVARQALAITEDDELAAGAVYPLRTTDAIAWAFLEYDLALSAALGLPLAKDDDGVRRVVAPDFWNDGVWPVITEGSRTG